MAESAMPPAGVPNSQESNMQKTKAAKKPVPVRIKSNIKSGKAYSGNG